jgi:two-component system sensor histidine kinase and response regulator WspE
VQAFSYRRPEPPERILRLTAENLNRLLGLAGESLVESRWLRPFTDSLLRLKRSQVEIGLQVAALRSTLEEQTLPERVRAHFQELNRQLSDARGYLVDRIKELETFDRRSAQLSHRLYLEVLRTRMRPFGEGVRRFPRMVRDLARSLGKEVKLEIFGESTPVDRDILECLEAPLAHLMHNAVDHGCETPERRERAGKPAENVVRLEARHSAGVLLITVTDDGAGVDIEQVRLAVVKRQLIQPDAAAKLGEADLLEFLFLPGFSLRDEVTEISGRGVGLDLVQTMIKSVRGTIRISNQPGRGLRIQLHLPLTLSVLRTLLVEVGGEPYAIPLSQMARAARIPRAEIQNLEGKPTFQLGDQRLALLMSHQILDYPLPPVTREDFPVVVLGDRNTRFGLAVDRFIGERELVVHALDKRLGKVTGVSAAAFMEDGSPVLIVDVEDLAKSAERLVADGLSAGILRGSLDLPGQKRKRILVADDSLTVREMQRKLLAGVGYAVDVAADGIEAWNAIRQGGYDLLISDVDMPRMDGFQLTALVKRDPNLKLVPVLIISYKDREDDRLRGLDAGADYYLTKGSFNDKLLLQAVSDLIGEPD